MFYYDGEMIVQEHKAAARKAAADYDRQLTPQSASRPAVAIRVMATAGALLIAIGYRLRARYDATGLATIEGPDVLRLSERGAGQMG